MVKKSIFLSVFSTLVLAAQDPLSIEEAIRRAWTQQAGLQAGQAMVDRARREAEALGMLGYPTLSASAGLVRTDEPMMAFGMKLNQSRVTQADFQPDLLNKPDPIKGVLGSVTLTQPLYAGGRIQAARRGGAAMAEAEAATQAFRKQQVALAIVQAYFGAQVAEQGIRFAEDTLKQARETERFVQSRVDQGLMLRSEGDRAKAFRAQSEAGLIEARQRLASARASLALLMGGPIEAPLSTPVEGPGQPETGQAGVRNDLVAARFKAQAAQEGIKAQQGLLKPEVGLTWSLGLARHLGSTRVPAMPAAQPASSPSEGGEAQAQAQAQTQTQAALPVASIPNKTHHWTTVSLGVKWTFSFTELKRVQAARAAARAAELDQIWQERQADHQVDEARRAVETAQARMTYARVALEASESVRTIRTARHREGLLPLVEVMDAETGLSGARTLLLNSQLEWRVSQAQLALALGHPIENVKE